MVPYLAAQIFSLYIFSCQVRQKLKILFYKQKMTNCKVDKETYRFRICLCSNFPIRFQYFSLFLCANRMNSYILFWDFFTCINFTRIFRNSSKFLLFLIFFVLLTFLCRNMNTIFYSFITRIIHQYSHNFIYYIVKKKKIIYKLFSLK